MKQIIPALVLILITSCKIPVHRKNEITKIDIATGGCLGPCPSVAISIDSALNYKYYGGRYASLQGYYVGKVSPQFWDSLNSKLEHIRYKLMDTGFDVALDAPETELLIHFNGSTKHIQTNLTSQPDSVVKVIHWLTASFHYVNLHRAKYNIHFETKAQNEPPTPPIKSVKFPPPDK